MPKVTEAHLEARREQILSAAAACFARKGFHQATMDDICREADLSPGAVYRYYAGKEEIIQAMGEESLRRDLPLIESLGGQQDTRHVLDELASFFFGYLDDAELCVLEIELWGEAMHNPRVREIQARHFERYQSALGEIVSGAQARGDINPSLDCRAVTQVLISFFEGLLLQKRMNPDLDVARYVEAAKAMVGGFFWTGGRLNGA